MTFDVCVVNSHSGSVVKRIPADTKPEADKIERGVNINLNRRDYHTEVRKGLNKNVSV